MVHKAIIIVQQVKLKLLFVWFPVLKAQPVDVPRSIKTQLSEPAGHDMTVAVPQPDIKELLFCHKTLCHYASRHFIIYERVSQNVPVKVIGKPQCLLISQGIGMVQPPAGNAFKVSQAGLGLQRESPLKKP